MSSHMEYPHPHSSDDGPVGQPPHGDEFDDLTTTEPYGSHGTPAPTAPETETAAGDNAEPTQPPQPERGIPKQRTAMRRAIGTLLVKKSLAGRLSYSPKKLINEHDTEEWPYELPKLPATKPSRLTRTPRVERFVRLITRTPDEGGKWGTSDARDKHNELFEMISNAGNVGYSWHKTPLSARIAERLAAPNQKHAQQARRELWSTQRAIYEELTGISLNDRGEPLVEASNEAWIDVLNPHNIAMLRHHIVDKWTEDTPVAVRGTFNPKFPTPPEIALKSGNIMALDPGLIASYLGISSSDWLKQMAGREQSVPSRVTEALGHYLSISDANLDSVRQAIVSRNDAPLSRLQNAETIPEEVWREELDLPKQQLRRLRNQVLVRREPGDPRQESNQQLYERLANITDQEKTYLFRIDEEVEQEMASASAHWGGSITKKEKQRRQHEIRARIYRQYFGEDMTDQQVKDTFWIIRHLPTE